MVLPRGYIHREQVASAIEQAKQKLGPEVVRLVHTVEEDSNSKPAMYFRIVLTDEASRERGLGRVANKIRSLFFDEIRPYEDWDMRAYFSFRNQPEEHISRNDPAWV